MLSRNSSHAMQTRRAILAITDRLHIVASSALLTFLAFTALGGLSRLAPIASLLALRLLDLRSSGTASRSVSSRARVLRRGNGRGIEAFRILPRSFVGRGGGWDTLAFGGIEQYTAPHAVSANCATGSRRWHLSLRSRQPSGRRGPHSRHVQRFGDERSGRAVVSSTVFVGGEAAVAGACGCRDG